MSSMKHRVVGGDIGLTLRAVDDQHVDLVQVLGGQLHRRGEAGAAQAHQTAGPDRVYEGLHIRHLRGGDGGVHRLLAVRGDDHGLLGRAVGRGNGGDLGHRTGNAGVDVGGDEAPCLAHHGAHIHLSPLATAGAAGAPMCCPMDRTILDGRGIATVSRLEVPFSWGTPAPCAERLRKLLIQISTSLYCILGITFVLFFVWRVGTPFLPGLSSRLLSLPKSIK